MERFIVQQKVEHEQFVECWIDIIKTHNYLVAQEYANYNREKHGIVTRILKVCNNGDRETKRVVKNVGGKENDAKRKNKKR